jgi:hypothetical protein
VSREAEAGELDYQGEEMNVRKIGSLLISLVVLSTCKLASSSAMPTERPISPPDAEATEESLGHRTALYRLAVTTEDGDLVALCYGTVYRKRERFVEGD